MDDRPAEPATGEPGIGEPGTGEPSDAELIARVRGRQADPTSAAAFAELYDRHRASACSLARQLSRSPSDADDLVADAFARLLEALRSGRGPTEAFRAYLLTVLRHLAYDHTRAERRLAVTDDLGELIGIDPEQTVVPFTDPALAGLERSLAARAFATLPERWQAVLWHLEVEGDNPADIAELFGVSANAVSALGYRAREGLRQAYLQEHLAATTGHRDRRHRETGAKLGAYTRGGLSRRDAARVETHLAECEECRSLAAELREVNSVLVRSVVGSLVLGAALVEYLAARGAPGAVIGFGATGDLAAAGHTVGAGGTLTILPSGAVGTLALGMVGIAAASIGLAAPNPAPAPTTPAHAPTTPFSTRTAPADAPTTPLPTPTAPADAPTAPLPTRTTPTRIPPPPRATPPAGGATYRPAGRRSMTPSPRSDHFRGP